MPKYWVKNYFAHGSFPEVGQKQNTERKKEEEQRLNDGENNGQAMRGARKHAWRTLGARMAHAFRTHGARKLPGPINIFNKSYCKLSQIALVTNINRAMLFY